MNNQMSGRSHAAAGMSFLVVGLGSMGKRRIRNLQVLGATHIWGVDGRADRRQEAEDLYGVKTLETIQAGLDRQPDAVVVSTPPDRHAEPAILAASAGRAVFIEGSVMQDGFDELERRAAAGIVVAPSCTMRFHPAIQAVKRFIDGGQLGRVAAFSHHFGEHLARWHPWEPYQDFYVSRRVTGGCREIVPFELVWLTWLCGDVDTVVAIKAQVGDLGVDIDDVYQMVLKFSSGCVGHLQVDMLQLAGYRRSRFVCTEGVIDWDWDARVVRVYSSDGNWREHRDSFSYNLTEGFYVDEMAAFVSAVRGETNWPHTIAADRQILKILEGAEKSSDDGIHVSLNKGREWQ